MCSHNEGFCCHQHAQKMKLERNEEKKVRKKIMVDEPHHCIHCNKDPCVFVQIECRLVENDKINFDEEDYAKDDVAYNSGRRKRAFQFAAFLLWEGINYRKQHYKCVEDGVHALFPSSDGKVVGFRYV